MAEYDPCSLPSRCSKIHRLCVKIGEKRAKATALSAARYQSSVAPPPPPEPELEEELELEDEELLLDELDDEELLELEEELELLDEELEDFVVTLIVVLLAEKLPAAS